MITEAQRLAVRKTSALLTAVILAAKVDGMSGVPDVLVKVVGTGNQAKFTAQFTHEESAGVFRVSTLAGNDGRVKVFSRLDDLLAAVVTIAPSVAGLAGAATYSLSIDNPEALAPTPSSAIATVSTLIKKLLAVRASKTSATMASGIRAIELVGNAALATGTPEQQAKYAEIVLRKSVIDHLIALYSDQDAALVALITSMGGTPPAP